MINLFQPAVGADELAAVAEVIESSWLGNGPRATEFEEAFAAHLAVHPSRVLSTTSCTEGLFQVLAALDLGPGDEVVLPTISFIGAGHAVRGCGATPVLCDVDPLTLNPTVAHVEQAITPRTRAILVLHYGGEPGAITDLAALAHDRSLLLIEDAACALGSSVDGRPCGTFGDAGVWSFDAAKLVTCGDGGMIWCRDPGLADRLRSRIRLGVSASGLARSSDTGRWWEIDPIDVARRATMNDVAATIGLVQLARMAAFLERRRVVAAAYQERLAVHDWLRLPALPDRSVARYFYPVQMAPEHRDCLALHLRDQGIYTNFRYWPLHRTALYRSDRHLPGADAAAASTLLLPLHQALVDRDVDAVVHAIGSFDAR